MIPRESGIQIITHIENKHVASARDWQFNLKRKWALWIKTYNCEYLSHYGLIWVKRRYHKVKSNMNRRHIITIHVQIFPQQLWLFPREHTSKERRIWRAGAHVTHSKRTNVRRTENFSCILCSLEKLYHLNRAIFPMVITFFPPNI